MTQPEQNTLTIILKGDSMPCPVGFPFRDGQFIQRVHDEGEGAKITITINLGEYGDISDDQEYWLMTDDNVLKGTVDGMISEDEAAEIVRRHRDRA